MWDEIPLRRTWKITLSTSTMHSLHCEMHAVWCFLMFGKKLFLTTPVNIKAGVWFPEAFNDWDDSAV